MKIYLAREKHEDDDYANDHWFGEIGIFYDVPLREYNPDTGKVEWCCSRRIGTAPGYMYPELSPLEYIELNDK